MPAPCRKVTYDVPDSATDSNLVNRGIYWVYLQSMGEGYLQNVGYPKAAIPLKSLIGIDDVYQLYRWSALHTLVRV